MVKHLAVPVPDPDRYMASTRMLVNDLAMDVASLRAEELTDWERVFTLASAIPEDVRADDVKMYFAVAVLMLTEARAKQKADSAELIRGELVCCDIFHRMEALVPPWDPKPKKRDWSAWKELKKSHDYHDLCFFGEWAAVIVEKGPRE